MRLTERLRTRLKTYGRTANNWANLSSRAGVPVNVATFRVLLSDEPEVNVSADTLESLYVLLQGGEIKFGNPSFPEPKPGRPKSK